MTGAGELLRATELLQLGVAADEACQPPPGDRLEPGAHRPSACNLVGLHRLAQPPDGHRPERIDLDIALGQS